MARLVLTLQLARENILLLIRSRTLFPALSCSVSRRCRWYRGRRELRRTVTITTKKGSEIGGGPTASLAERSLSSREAPKEDNWE